MPERANNGREINIREAADDDLTAVAAILNREIGESAYVYADAPVTLDERRDWLKAHQAASELHALVGSIDSENSPSIAVFARRGFREVARLDEVGSKYGTWRTQLLFLRAVEPPPPRNT